MEIFTGEERIVTEQYFGFQIKAAGTSYAEFASPEPDGWDEWEQPDKYGDESEVSP